MFMKRQSGCILTPLDRANGENPACLDYARRESPSRRSAHGPLPPGICSRRHFYPLMPDPGRSM